MPDGYTLPGWPLLMDEALSARFLQATRRDFRAGVAAGVYPPGRIIPPNRDLRWHREELRLIADRLFGLDTLAPAQQDAAAREAAKDALDGYEPTAARRAPALRTGRPQA